MWMRRRLPLLLLRTAGALIPLGTLTPHPTRRLAGPGSALAARVDGRAGRETRKKKPQLGTGRVTRSVEGTAERKECGARARRTALRHPVPRRGEPRKRRPCAERCGCNGGLLVLRRARRAVHGRQERLKGERPGRGVRNADCLFAFIVSVDTIAGKRMRSD